MGIPGLYGWLLNRVSSLSAPCSLQLPTTCDNLFIDLNGLVHTATKSAKDGEYFTSIFQDIEHIFRIANPSKRVYLALDGPPPRAKINHQRERRYRAILDADSLENITGEIYEEIRSLNLEPPANSESEVSGLSQWDITPGTPFMHELSIELRKFVEEDINEKFPYIEFIVSDSLAPMEGEHKILEYLRENDLSGEKNVVLSDDGDLVFLSFATDANIHVLRQESARKEQIMKFIDEPRYNLDLYRKIQRFGFHDFEIFDSQAFKLKILEYLSAGMNFAEEAEPLNERRIFQDLIFLLNFLGNDFQPNLLKFDIRTKAIDEVLVAYKHFLYSYDFDPAKNFFENFESFSNGSFAQSTKDVLSTRYITDENCKVKLEELPDFLSILRELEAPLLVQKHALPERETPCPSIDAGEVCSLDVLCPNLHGDRVPLNKAKFYLRSLISNFLIHGKVDTAEIEEKLNHAVTFEQTDAELTVRSNSTNVNLILKEYAIRNKFEMDLQKGKACIKRDLSKEAIERFKAVYLDEIEYEARRSQTQHDEVSVLEFENLAEFKRDYYEERGLTKQVADMCFNFVKTAQFTTLYYFKGAPSWDWYYPFHYAPFISDISDYFNGKILTEGEVDDSKVDKLKEDFTFDLGKPMNAFVQQLCVLPKQKETLFPTVFSQYIKETTDEERLLKFLFPTITESDLDNDYKRIRWQWVLQMPLLKPKEIEEIKDFVRTKQHYFSVEEKLRNERSETYTIPPKDPDAKFRLTLQNKKLLRTVNEGVQAGTDPILRLRKTSPKSSATLDEVFRNMRQKASSRLFSASVQVSAKEIKALSIGNRVVRRRR
eukprot:snap_masked-scaffold_14-processed-gene-3.45-mRNA-1 protein AED:0.28 eAED:0.29 QI:0/-1/0/1/-1/1/1/0/827